MHPRLWHPPIELSASEQVIVSRIGRAKLFIFLRQIRHRPARTPRAGSPVVRERSPHTRQYYHSGLDF
jgi:hypothetical protein